MIHLDHAVTRFGRRGTVLIVLGTLWMGIGLGVLVGPSPDPDALILHEMLPTWLRVALWGVSGAVAVGYGLRGPAPNDTRGYVVLSLMALERLLSFGASWLMWVVTSAAGQVLPAVEPVGYSHGWYAATLWLVIWALIQVVAGWRNPDPAPLPEPEQGV